jgi:hypothetical protein
MGQRLELQRVLEELLGSRNVYFQPPNNLQMRYPCIVYSRSSMNVVYAENAKYKHHILYQVLVIDTDPDSGIWERIAALPLCSYSRFYVADNLNHDALNLYY